MAMRKDDSTDSGVQIPIEGSEPDAREDTSDKPQSQADDTQADEQDDVQDGAQQEAADDDEVGGEADGDETDGDSDADDDLIASAEAIIEETSAQDQLQKAQDEVAQWQDRYMRLHAEWDTYRRRTGEQRAEERQRATESLMEDLLPVLDDFERSVTYAEENGEAGLLDGVKAIQTKLIDVLTKGGLETISPEGEPFNALEAQAVANVENEEEFNETVAEVYQKGYRMGKKVLRPAMVTVTTGGPQRPQDEEDQD